MANICDVSLTARGFKTKKDMNAFAKILRNVGNDDARTNSRWLPFFEVYPDVDYDSNTIIGEGWCKWSADRMLDSHVQSVKYDNPNITSLEELSSEFGIDIEVLGTEPGCENGQHYLIEDGKITLAEYFDYKEYETLDSYEAFVEENGDVVDEDTWIGYHEEDDEWIPVGEPDTPCWILDDREYPPVKDN